MANGAKKQSVKDGKRYLRESLIDVEDAFIADLKRAKRRITHDVTLGDATEDAWIDLLRQYLPWRYRVAKAFAIDHLGNSTDQLDCLIFDAHFTPALFGKGNNLYVPVEAVHAVFEIKPSINAKQLKYASEKVASLRKLKRTSARQTWSNTSQEPKKLFHIIGGILALDAEWKDGLGEFFLKNFIKSKGNSQLNIALTGESGFCDRFDKSKDPMIFRGQGSLMRGLFRLLAALRAQNTVPAIDWDKYEAVLDSDQSQT
jgi:hypothetical protein